MRFVAKKDVRGNVIGYEAVDDNGVVVGGNATGQGTSSLVAEPLTTIEGDFRTPSEKRAAAEAEASGSLGSEAAEQQYDLDSAPLTEPEPIEPQEEASEIQETVTSTPSDQSQALPTMLMFMAVVTLALLSLVLIGVLRKQYSTGQSHNVEAKTDQPTKNKKNAGLLWSLFGLLLYFTVTKVIVPTVALNKVDGTEKTEVKFIP